jgi:hypothetical protein
MLVSLHKCLPIAFSKSNVSVHSKSGTVFLFPGYKLLFRGCSSVEVPEINELASSNPWLVVIGVRILANFVISSMR